MFQVKTKIIFGENAIERVREFKFGEKCLLVCGKHFKASKEFNKVNDCLKGVEFETLVGIKPEPSIEEIKKYWDEINLKPDFVLAIGGGSVLDVAKVLAALMTNKNEPEELIGVEKVKNKIKKLIAIPTTSGSGSEVTKYAVVKYGGVKRSITSELICPTIAIVDPCLTLSLPKELTAYTALDALTHNLEAYISKLANPLTDLIAIQGTKLDLENIEKAYTDGKDLEARKNLALASVLGGIAITNASAGIVHALAHVLGYSHNVSHGLANAIFLPYSMKFNYNEKLKLVEHKLNVNLFEKLKGLNESLKISRLGEIIDKSEIKVIAEKAYENKRLMNLNPKPVTIKDLVEIMNESM